MIFEFLNKLKNTPKKKISIIYSKKNYGNRNHTGQSLSGIKNLNNWKIRSSKNQILDNCVIKEKIRGEHAW